MHRRPRWRFYFRRAPKQSTPGNSRAPAAVQAVSSESARRDGRPHGRLDPLEPGVDVWTPVGLQRGGGNSWGNNYLSAIGRLRTIEGAYFEALRIPFLRGRTFNTEDTATGPMRVVISQETARQLFTGDEDPIGLQSLLFGVSATDPIVFGLAALTLTTVALLASWIPARAATRVDPLAAVRSDN